MCIGALFLFHSITQEGEFVIPSTGVVSDIRISEKKNVGDVDK